MKTASRLSLRTLVIVVTLLIGAMPHGVASGTLKVGRAVGPPAQSSLAAQYARTATSFIVVPLSDRTPETSKLDTHLRLSTARDGVPFDIDGDGSLESISWPEPTSDLVLLAIDRNRNGRIDNGTELVGTQSIPKSPDGFTSLARLEPNDGDGALSASDSLFTKLLLWDDKNRNGRSDEGELLPFRDKFIKIGLGYFGLDRVDPNGNRIENRGWAISVADFKDRADDPIWPIYEVVPQIMKIPVGGPK